MFIIFIILGVGLVTLIVKFGLNQLNKNKGLEYASWVAASMFLIVCMTFNFLAKKGVDSALENMTVASTAITEAEDFALQARDSQAEAEKAAQETRMTQVKLEECQKSKQ